MTKRMLIDATHAEETRVVVLDGNRLEDFDVETSTKKQIKGNIYLAKIVRVEPSLQAAFVEYGGGRHGFLAFDEIHPDYYQIPVADRQRLLAQEAEEARREEEEEDRAAARDAHPGPARHGGRRGAATEAADSPSAAPLDAEPPQFDPTFDDGPGFAEPETPPFPDLMADEAPAPSLPAASFAPDPFSPAADAHADLADPGAPPAFADLPAPAAESPPPGSPPPGSVDTPHADPAEPDDAKPHRAQPLPMAQETRHGETLAEDAPHAEFDPEDPIPEEPPPETIGGEHDTTDEPRTKRIPSRFLRSYKIQEVIRRRQILLVQVEKEERGTKGAALTTYISLAGRYSVLMPNSPRGGGISRKITAPADRRRLKEVMNELDLPQGMGLIVRTAGANRPKPEIKRDAEYLLRLWDDIRERTMDSVAPALIHEEASLIKRSIRDVYSRDIDDIVVDGEDGWRAARDFMRMLMPTQARKVQLWRDPAAPPGTAGQPLFARHQVDAQLDAMLSPNVQLRSGGYLVINQAEALVAIDVNSGRSTRERGIEETALRTNMEAAEEVARQLRLRDLAGLIVIDFIDMESRKHNGMVEKRLKDALKVDRARIQLGHISHFGLLEMSRQRLRPSLAETSLVMCGHCGGAGFVRSTESASIHVLRAIEEEGSKRRSGEILVHAASPIVLYMLNHKRDRLGEIEARHGLRVGFAIDDLLIPPAIRVDKLRPYVPHEVVAMGAVAAVPDEDSWSAPEESEADEDLVPAVAAPAGAAEAPPAREAAPSGDAAATGRAEPATEDPAEAQRRRRRRRRRGGRREDGAGAQAAAQEGADGSGEAGGAASAETGDAESFDASETESPMPALAASEAETHIEGVPEHTEPGPAEDAEARARRRNRRGGRRRRRDDEKLPQVAAPGAEQPELPTVYIGPTPADPFGGQVFDIFDVMEQAEQRASAEFEAPRRARPAEPPPPVPPAETMDAAGRAERLSPTAATPVLAAPVETQAAAPAAEPVTAAEPAPAEPPTAPAIVPIVIGAPDAPELPKKRGWWHRDG